MLQVFVPIPKPLGSWGGACGLYYGMEIYCYDTSRERPKGQTYDPYSPKTYKYYPAEGAIVTAKFYNDRWSKTVSCQVPTHQPKYETIPWCRVGTYIPCDVCGDERDTYISIDVEVNYNGERWRESYPKALHIFCPEETSPSKPSPSPYIITVWSSDGDIDHGNIIANFKCDKSMDIHIGLYGSTDGKKYTLLKSKTVRLTPDPVRVSFILPDGYEYVGIAPVKPGTNTVGSSWVCAKSWRFRL